MARPLRSGGYAPGRPGRDAASQRIQGPCHERPVTQTQRLWLDCSIGSCWICNFYLSGSMPACLPPPKWLLSVCFPFETSQTRVPPCPPQKKQVKEYLYAISQNTEDKFSTGSNSHQAGGGLVLVSTAGRSVRACKDPPRRQRLLQS